jgi:hypothetical protein
MGSGFWQVVEGSKTDGGGLMQLVAYGAGVLTGNRQITFITVEGNIYPESAVISAGNGNLLKKVNGRSFNITDGSRRFPW